jgi:hypothetical protein
LDSRRVNWRAVKNLVLAAYFLTAPDKQRKAMAEGRRWGRTTLAVEADDERRSDQGCLEDENGGS